MIRGLWRLWRALSDWLCEDEPILVDQYRQLWARPVVIQGEERLPIARRVE